MIRTIETIIVIILTIIGWLAVFSNLTSKEEILTGTLKSYECKVDQKADGKISHEILIEPGGVFHSKSRVDCGIVRNVELGVETKIVAKNSSLLSLSQKGEEILPYNRVNAKLGMGTMILAIFSVLFTIISIASFRAHFLSRG